MDRDDVSLVPVYVGQCRFLRVCPPCMLALAVIPLATGNLGTALVLGVLGMLSSLWLPWRFVITNDGIALWFALGKRRFLARENVTVRADLGGAVVRSRGRQRFGYPLTNGLIERDRSGLRTVLARSGFDLVD